MSSVYLANFTKCSLILPETRVIAGLLLQGVEPREWERQVYELNVLQKRTAKTADSYATLARWQRSCSHPCRSCRYGQVLAAVW